MVSTWLRYTVPFPCHNGTALYFAQVLMTYGTAPLVPTTPTRPPTKVGSPNTFLHPYQFYPLSNYYQYLPQNCRPEHTGRQSNYDLSQNVLSILHFLASDISSAGQCSGKEEHHGRLFHVPVITGIGNTIAGLIFHIDI